MMDASKVSDEMKMMTNELYHKSIFDDPAISCQNIIYLVTHLKGIMNQCGCTEYDITLKYAGIKAGEAWYFYSTNNIGHGVGVKNQVLDRIDFLVKDPRFSKYKLPVAFQGR